MKKILARLLATSLCILGFVTHANAQCFIDKSHWTPVLNEEFNTSIADLQTRWKFTSGIPSNNSNPNWYDPIADPSNVHIDPNKGFIYFETKKLPTPIVANGQTYLYSAGNIESLFDDIPVCSNFSNRGYLYGMYEIRCKLPKKEGQYTAFWLISPTGPERELDVFEHNASHDDHFFSTVHFGTQTNKQECGNRYYYPFNIADDFHTWTVVWTPTKMTWFFDGRELKTDNNPAHVPGADAPNMSERCRYAKMILQTGSGLNYPDPNSTQFDSLVVDYIRIYKPNGYQPYTGFGNSDFDTWHDDQITLYANTPYKTSSDWNLDRLITNERYNSLGGLNVVQGGGKYIYKGDGDLLWNTYWNGSRFASFPLNGSVTIDDDISVAVPLELPFFRQGNRLGYYQNGAISYVTFNGRTRIQVNNVQSTILANSNGLQVIYLGNDNNLWQSTRTSLSSHSWLTNQITFNGNISKEVIFGSSSYDVIYCADLYGNLVVLAFNGYSWDETLASNNGDIYSSLTINSAKDKIYYRNAANNLVYYSFSGTWTQQSVYAISPYSNGQVVLVDNVASNICLDNDKPFYIGTDGRVWNIYQSGNNVYSAPLSWTLTYARRNLQVLNSRVYFVGNDGQIRSFSNGVCEVLNPACKQDTYSRSQALGAGQTALATAAASASSIGSFTIYPNPAKTDVRIELSFSPQPNTVLTITNAVGQIVREVQLKGRLLQFPVVDLPNGIYTIKLQSPDGVLISKFVKE